MKKHIGFTIFFGVVIFVFLGRLILMKAAFLGGDYLVQFYPWSAVYSEAIKSLTFPFWTRYFHCGFPLMAEGQIGGFYPLNIILFFALPFKAAYNFSVVIHFILAGIFTYIYTRKMGADEWGGALSALIFCFGSAYAGCFYNTVSVRTLIWFPLVLFLFEEYFESKKFRYVLLSAIVYGMQLLAGFVQMAFYSAIFYLIYFIQGLLGRRKFEVRDSVRLGLFFLISGIIFLPQFLLSWQLAGLSSRSAASLGFALWGSFSPFNIMSLCFPYWVFHGTVFYIGVFSIIFFMAVLPYFKQDLRIRQLITFVAVSIFLAMGAYNPIYVLFIKMTHLFGLRNPSKFIFFGVFASSVLTGIGFTKFFISSNERVRNYAIRTGSLLIGIMLGIFFAAKAALYFFRTIIVEAGRWLVSNFIAGKPYHRYDISAYLDRVGGFYQQLVEKSSLGNAYIISSLILCASALLLGIYIAKNGKARPFFKIIVMSVIFVDLYIFGLYGIGFSGNIKPFDHLKPRYSAILDTLKADKELFRILPFDLPGMADVFWAMPNANTLEGIDSIAAYTPLAQQRYKGELFELEVVDDSLGVLSPSDEAIADNHRSLRILNVKYIVSKRRLSYDFLRKINEENGLILYELVDYLPRIFFTRDIEGDIAVGSVRDFSIKEYRSGYAEAELMAPEKGYVVFSENYYPGWSAYVDGRKAAISKLSGIAQYVEVSKGRHGVVFKYNPMIFRER